MIKCQWLGSVDQNKKSGITVFSASKINSSKASLRVGLDECDTINPLNKNQKWVDGSQKTTKKTKKK